MHAATSPQPGSVRARGRTPIERIYLVAPSGNPNYGDEFILRTWLRHLAVVRPDADVVVDCHTPGQAAVLLQGSHPRLTFVDTIWRICLATSHLASAEAAVVAADVVNDPGRMPRIVSGIELLTAADTVHLVGGGYINAVWPHHMALLAAAAAAAERSGGRVLATGQGLVPVGEPDRLGLLRELQSRFALFDVRDRPSFAFLAGEEGSVEFTGDDAWLGIGPDAYDAGSEAAKRPIVFCLQSDLMDDFADGRGIEGLTSAITRLIERWRLSGRDVAVIEGIPGADRIVFDRIAHLLTGAEFVPFSAVWACGLPATAEQVWVSTRFHPHLLAAAIGASGLALSGRADYYPNKHQSLVEAGSRWRVADSTDLPDTPVRDGGFAAEAVQLHRSRKAALAAEIYPPAPSLLHRARNSLRLTGSRWVDMSPLRR
ncbi:polysaccharide pyruvyl transferase family protein [Mycobacterium sp. IDR2000157661]|uniref:polysaccharide pyruvyl transferase family protein n=1 Tax=Mycobacterium sp. IDR2000157661 TaxID=2867005 RepID=UPI001EEB8032|nr:polysaccharide pyruvyl transferase family protein [Mycobacterium sp. IDR2000157661]ULE32903.1 polysaccharide pyruvyl transferase family protein [Mycobacterium sp. IDR2000157661]